MVLKQFDWSYPLMDWDLRRDEIQGLFFRAGAYTHFVIQFDADTDTVDWRFSFADLGMYHTLESHATVSLLPHGTYCVDGIELETEDEAFAQVFAGHYDRFLRGMYQDAGFTLGSH